LNRDGIPSPRVGTRHTAFGWGASTIRAMLRNERYKLIRPLGQGSQAAVWVGLEAEREVRLIRQPAR
jgi:hypothetical protein